MSIPAATINRLTEIAGELDALKKQKEALGLEKRKLLFPHFITEWVADEEYRELCLAHITNPPIFKQEESPSTSEEYTITYVWDNETVSIIGTRDYRGGDLHVEFDGDGYDEEEFEDIDVGELSASQRLAIILMKLFAENWWSDSSFYYTV